MDIEQFFERVLPPENKGHHILVCRKPFSPQRTNNRGVVQTYWVTRAFNSFQRMAEQAKKWSGEGFDTYHACATFKQINWESKVTKAGKPYKVISDTRTQVNAAFTRAQWLDIDVGPGKDYETREEALTSLAAVCSVLGIPLPMVVSSGKTGLHCYWAFTRNVPAATAALLMGSFLLALGETDFRHDTSRTADTASVLRPLGTFNYKTSKPHKVRLLQDAEPVDPQAFYKPFNHLLGKARLLQSPEAAAEAGMFDELDAAIRAGATPCDRVIRAGSPEKWAPIDRDTLFVPFSIKRVAPECAVVRSFYRHRPDMPPIPEPLWRGLLGLTMASVEGRRAAHALSKRSDTAYSREEAENYMDRWTYGPTSCKYFAGHSKECATCPHQGKIIGPKELGEIAVVDVTPVPADKEDSSAPHVVALDAHKNVWPSERTLPFWNDEKYLADMASGKLKRVVTTEELKENPSLPNWLAFSNVIYYPRLMYWNSVERKRMVVINAQTGVSGDPKAWREVEIESEVTNDAGQLSRSLAKVGINYMGTKNKNSNVAYIQDMLAGLKAHGLEATTYSSFGWHDDGFVIGNNFLTGREERPVFVSDHLPDVLQGDYGRAGTWQEWARLVNLIYNRPGAEPYQFIFLAALASVLIKLNNPGGMWHGLSVGLTGPGGLGKTTTCKAACSMYGDPNTAQVQANTEGSTLLALVARMGAMRHLPMIMDEITGRELRDIQALLYSITAGKPKNGCAQDGAERASPHEWAMIPFVTGNENLTSLLSQGEQAKQAATQVRVFEIALDADFNRDVFKGVDGKELIEEQLLGEQYGEAGIKWIQYVIRNQEKIVKHMREVRGVLAKKFPAENEERFYYDLLTAAVVAGTHAKHIGLIKFNVTNVRNWALGHIKQLRNQRRETERTPGDYLQMMLADMHKRTVVTEYWSPGKSSKSEDPNDAQHLHEPCARRATKSRRYLMTRNGFQEWCKDNKLLYTDLQRIFTREGIILADGLDRASLFSGLTSNVGLGGTQARVLEFRYDAIAECEGFGDKEVSKVTNIRDRR